LYVYNIRHASKIKDLTQIKLDYIINKDNWIKTMSTYIYLSTTQAKHFLGS